MNDLVKSWQEDAQRAFDWVNRVYEQAQVVLDDAEGYLEEEEWSVSWGGGFGGVAMSTSDLSEWPFIYFKVLGAMPKNSPKEGPGVGLFFGLTFYGTKRLGPTCVAGRIAWSDPNANCDHWILLAAMGDDSWKSAEGSFEIEGGIIKKSKPTARAARLRPGVGEVTWFELPLGSISSADRLREIVDAAKRLVDGDEAGAVALLETSAK